MAKLSLMFDNKLVREVPVGSRPVTIGRAPDNDLSVDNLAVSSYHAKIFFEGGRMVIEPAATRRCPGRPVKKRLRRALTKRWCWTPRSADRCSSRPRPWVSPCSLPPRA